MVARPTGCCGALHPTVCGTGVVWTGLMGSSDKGLGGRSGAIGTAQRVWFLAV
ncbi:MAG: hypothetical protein ACO331_10375 [Prochlorothrix sp.]